MENNILEQFTTKNQAMYEAMKELAEIQAEVAERLFAQQRTAFETFMKAGTEQVELVTGVKDYKELLTAETDFAKSQGDKVLAYTQEAAEILDEARERLTAWVERNVQEAAKPVADVAKTFTEAADKAA